MSTPISRMTVIGDGAMGTLCALMAADRGSLVTLWGRSSERIALLAGDRENCRYLPGHPFPASISLTSSKGEAFPDPTLIVSAVPCQYMRKVWQGLAAFVPAGVPIVSVAKGIELDTLMTPTQIIRDCLGDVDVACLSGPCIAPEVARRLPTSVVVAATDDTVASIVQAGLSTDFFRLYTNPDLVGVETAGAVKNVIALAAGIGDGLKLGDNAKASLVTRGLVEIRRLGVALGACAETFSGLAGVGDLVTTCMSKIGRNRSAGERIGRGELAKQVIENTSSVIEGIPSTRAVLELAKRHGVELPIVSAVSSVLFEDVSPADAIRSLMTRPLRGEQTW